MRIFNFTLIPIYFLIDTNLARYLITYAMCAQVAKVNNIKPKLIKCWIWSSIVSNYSKYSWFCDLTMGWSQSYGVYLILYLCHLLTNIHAQCNQNLNGICYIDGSSTSGGALQCGTKQCIVTCPSHGSCSNKQIICPHDAKYCIINCNAVNSFQSLFI